MKGVRHGLQKNGFRQSEMKGPKRLVSNIGKYLEWGLLFEKTCDLPFFVWTFEGNLMGKSCLEWKSNILENNVTKG